MMVHLLFALAQQGLDVVNPDVPAGHLRTAEAPWSSRPMVIYTPPEFSAKRKYPVLYLLHGMGGNEHSWAERGAFNVILDNLIAAHRAQPMIVVCPNGQSGPERQMTSFAKFEGDMIEEVVHWVEAHYPVLGDRESRAIAGLSMGGGQSLNIGLKHPETFAWVGGFSGAPNTNPPTKFGPDTPPFRLIWVSCGDKDGLFSISKRVHDKLDSNHVAHTWRVYPGAHDWQVWRPTFIDFAQLVFQKSLS